MNLVNVVVESQAISLNMTFSYLCEDPVDAGCRVKVNFAGRDCAAMVMSVQPFTDELEAHYIAQGIALKAITSIIDHYPVLDAQRLALALTVADETLSNPMLVIQSMLPKALKAQLAAPQPPKHRVVELLEEPAKASVKQRVILDALRGGPQPYTAIKTEFGSAVDTLIKNGCVSVRDEIKTYHALPVETVSATYDLSQPQIEALKAIRTASQRVVCLYGPTGSGKTEVYLTLAKKLAEEGKQVVILVPEIGLTPQMIARVQARFGEDVIVYHSHLSDTERYLQYQRVVNRESAVVVGTRSAIWLPFTDLGLIVMDEEHDSSYKQDSAPRYHARDVAIHRAETFDAKVILGSATPSFETYARAKKGVYGLVNLPSRISGVLPKVRIIAPDYRVNLILAPQTQALIQQRLDRHEQVVVLLNRRGFAPIYQCVSCFSALSCPHCDRLLNVHTAQQVLKCHACDYTIPMVSTCPTCGHSTLRMLGVGTQRVETELQRLFPSARIARMDSDATSTKGAHERILGAFERGETDILLGTQMIAKGLDNPKVTLSVILDIDKSLLRTDYRSVEAAFDLMVQAAGRSGRGDDVGEVVVQSALRDHYALTQALRHDFPGFYATEMAYRQAGQNPPYTYLITVTLSHRDAQVAYDEAHYLASLWKPHCTVLGPGDLGKVADIHRMRLILKSKDLTGLRQLVRQTLRSEKLKSSWMADVNPLNTL
jgi:primosomal protein N' (replication factor Y) (superfamily II helicase)